MNAKAPETELSPKPKRRNWPLWVRLSVWVLGVPLLLLVLLYARLAFGPVDLELARPNVEQAIRESLPPNSEIELGQFTLSLSDAFRPVLRFAPVTFTDVGTGARVSLEALEIGFSLQALIGQPGAVVSLIGPQLQVLQDLLGPRLASFGPHEGADPDVAPTIAIRQGSDAYPDVRIGARGLQLSGPPPDGSSVGIRSDNEWLIYNVEGMEQAISGLEAQARAGQFARLEVRGGSMEMLDPVFGIARRFDNLQLELVPGTFGRKTTGSLGADLAGRHIEGSFERVVDKDNVAKLDFSLSNFDFAALLPMLDDPDGIAAIRGAGALDGNLSFDGDSGKVTDGTFDIDLTGSQMRLQQDYFPISKGRFSLDWDPQDGKFAIAPAELGIGLSSGEVSGEMHFGLDDVYGSTLSAALTIKDFYLKPYDLPEPDAPFSSVEVKFWSAPLYGAVGIDKLVAKKPGVELRAKGRFDLLRQGIGIKLHVAGEGASADDLKRLWPYFIADGGREWFVGHVLHGKMKAGSLRFDLPVGALDPKRRDQPLPPNSGWIDMIGSDVTLIPTEGFAPVALGGDVSLQLRDNKTSVTLGKTQIVSDTGMFSVTNGAVEIDVNDPPQSVIQFSGDLEGDIPALVAFAESQSPGVIDGFGLPFDARSISGTVEGQGLVVLSFDDSPTPTAVDYAVNGVTHGFTSTAKIADRQISNGQLNFQANSDEFHVNGTADLDGVPAELILDGFGDAEPEVRVASTVDVDEFKSFGFDLSDLMSGKIRFVAKPLDDGGLQIAADLTQASLDLKDIGLSKAAGVAGEINAEIRQDGTLTKVTQIDLSFGQVRVKGGIEFDGDKGLVAADFSDFALSQGDTARLSVAPVDSGGFRVRISGEQFDLKPMLKRYFALDQPSTGAPQATAVAQELIISAKLQRALGFYGVTAYNVDVALDLKGEDVLDASLQAQFAEGNAVSLTSNPTTGGRLMSVAFNDLGTLLRYLNVYPRVLGGAGSLTLRTNAKTKVDRGEIRIKNFALVDEAKVAEIVGNHKDSRKLIAEGNRLDFQNGQVTFVRRSDRIEVTDAVLDGGSIGGTLKGFIYTKTRQYDLTGTYIPLFGLNNLFQRLPIFGELLGGRQGEGLVGVTFAIRGDLDQPEFVVNPVSILAPGVFRSMFEFRATEAPREQVPETQTPAPQ